MGAVEETTYLVWMKVRERCVDRAYRLHFSSLAEEGITLVRGLPG